MGGDDVKSLMLVVGAGAIWSTVGPVLKFGVELGGEVIWIAASRTIFSAMPALVLRRFKSLFKPEIILYGALLVSTFQYSYLLAVHVVGVSTAVVLLYTSPAWVILFSRIMLKERITLPKLASLALALTGVVFVSGVLEFGFETDLQGIGLGVASGLIYGLMTVYGKIFRNRGIEPLDIALLTPAWAFVVLAPIAAIVTREFTVGLWLLSPIYMGIASGSIAYYLFFKGIGGTEAGRAGIAALVEPALGVLWGILLLGETLSTYKAIGSLLIFLAIASTIVESRISSSQQLLKNNL